MAKLSFTYLPPGKEVEKLGEDIYKSQHNEVYLAVTAKASQAVALSELSLARLVLSSPEKDVFSLKKCCCPNIFLFLESVIKVIRNEMLPIGKNS